MKKLSLAIAIVLLSGCGWLAANMHTILDVANCLCHIATKSKTEVELDGLTQDAWCAKNIDLYVDAAKAAQKLASTKAGLPDVSR